ncbi:MAG: hypothetical protein K5745_07205 [Saccharofermentans sp.]|nr:hypothetical protein [Saccharofermentans sp.]
MSKPPRVFKNKDKPDDKSFGGSQMWFKDAILQNSGCGVVAGCDAVLRLLGEEEFSREDYMDKLMYSSGFIKPFVLPFMKGKPRMIFGKEFVGSIGVSRGRFKRGIKRLAKDKGLELDIRGMGLKKGMTELPKALGKGLPVAMIVIAPFDNVEVKMAHRTETISYHWMTLTGMDSESLEVSTWGYKATIALSEFKKPLATASFFVIDKKA